MKILSMKGIILRAFWDFKPMSSKISRLVVHVIIITMMATRK